MLRFRSGNVQPVDFYRPLSVDVSVEYELPKEVAPPPGSAPLLIIHPSAYLRTPAAAVPAHQNLVSNRLAELSSSLYYLRSSSRQQQQQQLTWSQGNGHESKSNGSGSSAHGSSRYGGSSSAITRSRSVNMGASAVETAPSCPYGKCDECSRARALGLSSAMRKLSSAAERERSTRTSSRVKGPVDATSLAGTPSSTSMSTSNSSVSMPMDFQSSVASSINASSSSNKRLRMMNQQSQSHSSSAMEPLNLVTQSSTGHTTSSFPFGPAPGSFAKRTPVLNLNYSSTIAAQQQQQQRAECGAVPRDKGSGSDSGVCSENESEASPPMALFSRHGRRSFLSQDLTNSGCYCCCCPSSSSATASSSMKKGSGILSKTRGKNVRNGSDGSWPWLDMSMDSSDSVPSESARWFQV